MPMTALTVKKQYYSGDYSIIDSGTVISVDFDSDITVGLELGTDFSFSIRFSFVTDEDKEGQAIWLEQESKKVLAIVCTNFNENLGTGSSDMFQIANYEEKKLYLRFWVSSIGNKTSRRLEYAIYREESNG